MKKEELVTFYHKYKLYIFPLVVSLSSLFLIIFAIYPQTMSLVNNRDTSAQLMAKQKFLESKVAALEKYDQNDLSRKVSFALSVLPPEKDYGNILGVLQQIAAQSGFSIFSLNFENSSAKVASANSYQVKMVVRGTKQLLPTLMQNIENSNRVMRITGFSISSNQVSASANVDISVGVLYAQLPQVVGGVDAPLPELSFKDEQFLSSAQQAPISVPVNQPIESQPIESQPLPPRGKENPFE